MKYISTNKGDGIKLRRVMRGRIIAVEVRARHSSWYSHMNIWKFMVKLNVTEHENISK